jgi:tetratricopeptide (TPR) repeat protein
MATTRTRFDLSRLAPAGGPVVGQEGLLQKLDEAWKTPGRRLLWLRAGAGMGKSALVNRWLATLREAGFPGAERVFGWTFHGQGAAPVHASADAFLDYTLRWLGDERPAAGSPWERGQRLGRLVQGRRTLLVLDGVEKHLKEPATFVDPALAALSRVLGGHNPGLCVITSQLTGPDHPEEKSLRLDKKAAKELFQGLKATDRQVEQAVAKLKGHPYALVLLVAYITEAAGGDVAAGLKKLFPSGRSVREPVRHMLDAYQEWLQAKPERARRLSLLRLAGLFQGPADWGAVRAVRGTAVIKGLTEGLEPSVTDAAVELAAADLRHSRLLAGPGNPGELDAHRPVRGHFEGGAGAGASAASTRLFDHFCGNAPEVPETLDDLLCLHASVVHGCLSGCAQDAYDRVYRRRISPEGRFWSTFRLGAFDAEVMGLSAFFEKGWTTLRKDLKDEEARLAVLMAAGVNLRSLGRLEEAEEAFEAALAAAGPPKQGAPARDPGRAADAASSLSEVALARGRIDDAVAHARAAVAHADSSRDLLRRTAKRAYLADALHQAGRFGEAEEAFRAAEAIQESWQPDFDLLYSLRGFQYHDFLLREPEALLLGVGRRPSRDERRRAEAQALEALVRVRRLFRWRRDSDSSLDVALEHLVRGRARLARDLARGEEPSDAAGSRLDQAVALLREYAAQYRLPCGLLARAAFRRVSGDLAGAEADLDEALGIAEHGEMVLLQADVLLERARLRYADGDRKSARTDLDEAMRLVKKHRYHRRDRDVADLDPLLPKPAPAPRTP